MAVKLNRKIILTVIVKTSVVRRRRLPVLGFVVA